MTKKKVKTGIILEDTLHRNSEGKIEGSITVFSCKGPKGEFRPEVVKSLVEEWENLDSSDIRKKEGYRLFFRKDRFELGIRDSECEEFYKQIIKKGYEGKTHTQAEYKIIHLSKLFPL